MAKVNYRHMKKRREEAQKKEQAEKKARRGRVPAAQDPYAEPAPFAGTPPPRSPS